MPTITIDVTVPSDVIAAVSSWRSKQIINSETGELKYPNNLTLLKDIIKQAIIRILDQEATATMQAQIDAIAVARANIAAIKDSSVS